jgi:hypothetical protein
MRVLRRSSKRQRKQEEARASLDLVGRHAEAGRLAQTNTVQSGWAPPQVWSNGASPSPAPAPVSPNFPAPTVAAMAPPVPPVPSQPAAPAGDVPAQLLRVLEVVTTMCDHVIEYIEADRVERRMMIEALTKLARTLGEALPAPSMTLANTERLIGGSIAAGPDPTAAEPEIDLRDHETAVEVKCRFGDRWVDGFEICEVMHGGVGDEVRYRLRRRIDGVVLPESFSAADIRHVETFEELTETPHQQRHWSPL